MILGVGKKQSSKSKSLWSNWFGSGVPRQVEPRQRPVEPRQRPVEPRQRPAEPRQRPDPEIQGNLFHELLH